MTERRSNWNFAQQAAAACGGHEQHRGFAACLDAIEAVLYEARTEDRLIVSERDSRIAELEGALGAAEKVFTEMVNTEEVEDHAVRAALARVRKALGKGTP